jgi:predicted negative regulator of RcsB-dependent stress response
VQGYTRRQLKENRFAETTKDAVQWTSGHRSLVTWGLVLVVIAVAGYFGAKAWLDRQSEAANTALGGALRTLNSPLRAPDTPTGIDTDSFTSAADRAKAAAKQFQAVADSYKLTKAGKLARYMGGMATMQAGDNAAAEQQLKTVAESGDKSIAALGKMALASLYRSTNRQAEAAKIYKDLQDHPTDTVSKAQAQLEMAEMYEKTDPQQAASLYQQIQKENPTDVAGQIAAARLSTVK